MNNFDSDYMCGAHPEVMDALVRTNGELTVGYGMDEHTKEAKRLIREACGAEETTVRFVTSWATTEADIEMFLKGIDNSYYYEQEE